VGQGLLAQELIKRFLERAIKIRKQLPGDRTIIGRIYLLVDFHPVSAAIPDIFFKGMGKKDSVVMNE